MSTTNIDEAIHTIHIVKEVEIDAPVEIVFEAALAEMSDEGQMPDGTPFPMKIERWPGGRWFRDLGDGAGHYWGHVQVIKPPKLIEVCGPMFMSYPAINHLQYRVTAEGTGSRLKITHRAFGQIPSDHRRDVGEGWAHGLARIREIAERLKRESGG